jgi:hypothetical protein
MKPVWNAANNAFKLTGTSKNSDLGEFVRI